VVTPDDSVIEVVPIPVTVILADLSIVVSPIVVKVSP